MNDRVPAVRASLLRSMLAGLESLGGDGIKIRRALADTSLTAIECAGALVWLPVELHLELSHCMSKELGRDQFRRLVQDAMRRAYLESSGHRLVHMAMRMFGLDPGSLARFLPSIYGALFRACGEWTVERLGRSAEGDEAIATLVLDGLPAVCVGDEIWRDGLASCVFSLLVLADADGEVEVDAVGLEQGWVRFRMSWRSEDRVASGEPR